ncbi:MAG: amino acid ABC transporter permease [Herbaspirillum sp.]|nr:amino acid ABC transporter permease [Herbaspirillum sp.]
MSAMTERLVAGKSKFTVIHRRSWLPWLLAALILAAGVRLVSAAISSRIIDLKVVARYIFSEEILTGALNTVLLGTTSLAIALVLGLLVALMRISRNRLLAGMAAAYVYVFRGTPLLIQIIFWFNAFPTMFPEFALHLPLSDQPLVQAKTTDLVTPYLAALIALSLAEAAYMAEIIRAGMLAVDNGQREAVKALGMTPVAILRRVVLPQACRIILPATGNQYILLLKSSSLASVIGFLELVRISTDIYSANFRVVELLAIAAFWYLVMTAFVTALQSLLERSFPQR